MVDGVGGEAVCLVELEQGGKGKEGGGQEGSGNPDIYSNCTMYGVQYSIMDYMKLTINIIILWTDPRQMGATTFSKVEGR